MLDFSGSGEESFLLRVSKLTTLDYLLFLKRCPLDIWEARLDPWLVRKVQRPVLAFYALPYSWQTRMYHHSHRKPVGNRTD